MSSEAHHTELHVSPYKPSTAQKTVAIVLLGIGIITFAMGLILAKERIWPSYLVSFFYFSCLGLGGLFFAAINHIAKAGWSVSVRRLSESMTSFIPMTLFLGLILLFGFKYLYPWADPQVLAENPVIAAKAGYLNTGSFVFRLVLFCAGWLIFRYFIVGNSTKQDKTGDESLTQKSVGYSIGFIVFFALSFSLFSVDLLMSLLPSWYSTIFGIYCFAGLFQASLAVMTLLIVHIRNNGFVKGYLTEEHQHDVVKFLKGFTVFWAYIAFSQFMLIWYANIPEETEYYIMRSQNGWLGISVALLVFRFIVPFLALLPRDWKRNNNHVTAVACLILVMQYVDVYWMVYPNFFDGQAVFGFWEVGIFAGFSGLFLLGVYAFLQKNSLVPLKDPRLSETISHQVTY